MAINNVGRAFAQGIPNIFCWAKQSRFVIPGGWCLRESVCVENKHHLSLSGRNANRPGIHGVMKTAVEHKQAWIPGQEKSPARNDKNGECVGWVEPERNPSLPCYKHGCVLLPGL